MRHYAYPEAGTPETPSALSAADAFRDAMGASDMPHENSTEFDNWLFMRGWNAGAADLREKLSTAERERDRHYRNLLKLLQPLKDVCDRDWKDESPEQIVAIAANAIYWRDQELNKLRGGEPK